MKRWQTVPKLCFIFLLASCSQIDQLVERQERALYDSPKTFFSSMRELDVEVAYEPRAEPFVGEGFNRQNLWDFVEANLAAAFQGRQYQVALHVPKSLAAMREIPAVRREHFNNREILELAERYREGRSNRQTGSFFVLFLNGAYEENGLANRKILGISLSGTTVIAIFKPFERETIQDQLLAEYLEQSTLIHEMGHALGLVNNGIPLTSPHHDSGHGAHCTNAQCVMYYQNEGPADLRNFVMRFMATGNLVVFGSECLNDFWRYRP